jgi:hypothetical protein
LAGIQENSLVPEFPGTMAQTCRVRHIAGFTRAALALSQ